MIRALRVLIVVAAVATLAACSSGSGYSELDRAATPADVLPTELPDEASDNLSLESVRFAGELDGIAYYLVRTIEPGDMCVMVYRSADDWVNGCSGGTPGVFVVTSRGVEATVAPDGSPELDEGTPVGSNIVVR
jgi:hypothetical protein